MNKNQIEYKILKLKKRRLHLTNRSAVISSMIDELRCKLDDDIDLDQGFGVYILRCHDLYKIGKTSNLKTRLKELQAGNPYHLKVVGFIPTDHKRMAFLEKLLHDRFGDLNVNGEWFRLSENEIHFLNKMMQDSVIDFEEAFKRLDDLPPEDEILEYDDDEHSLMQIDKFSIKILKIVIKRLQDRSGDRSISKDEVIEELESAYGKPKNETKNIIDKMRRDGDLFEPRPGMIRLP